MSILQRNERADLVRQAFWLEWFTIAWLLIEAAVAVSSGLAAASVTLLAFGLDSVIELLSAGVLVWRLMVELRRGRSFSEKAERAASRIGGALLLVLAAYVVISALWNLWTRQVAEFSWLGLSVAALAIPIMYCLSRRKMVIALRIGSRALRADAVESIACGWLSVVVVVGLAAQYVTGAWWVDSVTSLAIVWFLLREGREAWAGDECRGGA